METSLDEVHKYIARQATKFGNVFAFYSGSEYTVVLHGKATIHEAFVKKDTDFADRATFFTERNYNNTQKHGIQFSAYNDAFRDKLQLVMPILRDLGFGQRKMEQRIQVEISELVHQVELADGHSIDPYDVLQPCAVNVIAGLVFGRRYPLTDATLSELSQLVQAWITGIMPELDLCPALRFIPSFRRRMFHFVDTYSKMMQFYEREIVNVMRVNETRPLDCLVTRYLKQTGQDQLKDGLLSYDRRELHNVLRDLTVTGSVSIVRVVRWGLLELANDVTVQRRVQQELDSVVPRDRLPSQDDMASLPWTEALMLEVWRRHTLDPFGIPHATLRDTEVGGFYVPAGTRIITDLYGTHMDPAVFPDPESFKPDRFIGADGKVTGRDKLVTFSFGKRSCKGEALARCEVFCLFAAILQHFDVRPEDGVDRIVCSELVYLLSEPTPFKLRFIARHA